MGTGVIMSVLRMLLVVLAFGLGGCQVYEAALDRIIPDDARPMLAATQALAIDSDTDQVASHWHPDVDVERLPALLEQLATIRPATEPARVRLIEARRNISTSTGSGSVSRLSTVYELHWPETDMAVSTVLQRTGDAPWQIIHFNMNAIDRSLSGPDSIESWGLARLLWVGLAGSIVVFVLFTTVSLYRYKRVKRRILWTLFILGGCFPVFAMDWSTTSIWLEAPSISSSGTGIHFNLFEIRLLGASFMRDSLAEPWIVEAAVPIGAILFWWRVMRGGPTRRERAEARPR